MFTWSWCHKDMTFWYTCSALCTQTNEDLRKKVSENKYYITSITAILIQNTRVLYVSHLLAVLMASWFGGGTVKHTEGTMASFPVGLITFHLVLWELSSSTHSSPRFIVIWEGRQGKQDRCKYQKNREQEERGLRWWEGCREWGKEEEQ